MIGILKTAENRYLVHVNGHIITFLARDLLALMDYALEHAAELEREKQQELDTRTHEE